jgi:hypothetical protein
MAATGGLAYLMKTETGVTAVLRVAVMVRPVRRAVEVLLLCSERFPFGVHDVSPPPPPPQDTSSDRITIMPAQLREINLMGPSLLNIISAYKNKVRIMN